MGHDRKSAAIARVFLALTDARSEELQLPAWVKAHLDRHPELRNKLEQGELVGIGHAQENPVPRPAATARSSVLLFPVIADGALHAVIGVISHLQGPQPSQEEIETIRHICHYVAPLIASLRATEKRAARATEESEALEASVQMRSHLQHNTAHELRTPLAAIRGYARMILDGRAGEINNTQREYLSVVTENTNRLINLVSWMSYVAELGSQHLRLSTFDLRDVWAECVKANQKVLTEKSISVKEQIPNESFDIIGDREKLFYVFNHLIAAAVKFTNSEGCIVAEFSHGRDREVTVKMSDTGADIPAEMLNKIFNRSFSAIPAQPADADFTTFSLSGVYDIVGMHGGRMFMNSKAGEGSTLLFTLPDVMSGGEEKLSHEQAVNSSRRRR